MTLPNRAQRAAILCLCLLALCAACTAPAAPSPPPLAALWNAPVVLARAAQSDAPALLVRDGGVFAAWIGADTVGVHTDVRAPDGSTLILPLPPVHPRAQAWFPAGENKLHLLWLDADYERRTPDTGARLWAALVTPALDRERGPVLLSTQTTFAYAAAADGAGGVWTLWTGGAAAEPVLYAQHLSARGLPREPQQVAAGVAQVALARHGVELLVFWVDLTGSVFRARLVEGQAQDVTAIARLTAPAGTLAAGVDSAYGYLFLTGYDGVTRLLSGALDAPAWGEARALALVLREGAFVTGFNGGAALPAVETSATADGTPVSPSPLFWVTPLAWGAPDLLPAAAWDGRRLGIAYFQRGVLAAFQPVADAPLLAGLPALHTDRDLHLYLAWASPRADGESDLLLMTTRR